MNNYIINDGSIKIQELSYYNSNRIPRKSGDTRILFKEGYNPSNVHHVIRYQKSISGFPSIVVGYDASDGCGGVLRGYLVGDTFHYITTTWYVKRICTITLSDDGSDNNHFHDGIKPLELFANTQQVRMNGITRDIVDLRVYTKHIENYNVFKILKQRNLLTVYR